MKKKDKKMSADNSLKNRISKSCRDVSIGFGFVPEDNQIKVESILCKIFTYWWADEVTTKFLLKGG